MVGCVPMEVGLCGIAVKKVRIRSGKLFECSNPEHLTSHNECINPEHLTLHNECINPEHLTSHNL